MKQRLIVAFIIIGLGLTIVYFVFDSTKQETQSLRAGSDLSDHYIYSEYVFGKDDTIIDIGVQPLWIPTSIITEMMERDLILKDHLEKLRMTIRFHHFLKGADVNFFIKSGDLEIGIGGDMPVLTAVVNADVIVTSLIQKGFCSIVAKQHILLNELKGKRIGYAYGSNAHYALLQCLSNAGLNEDQVQMVPLDVNEMPTALNDGRIDAFSAWEPTPTIAMNKFTDQVVIYRVLTSGYLYFSPQFAQNHKEAVNYIVASQVRAINWLQQNRNNLLLASQLSLESGGKLSGIELDVDSEALANIADKDLLGTSTIPFIPKGDLIRGSSLFREFEFLKKEGTIPASTSWADITDNFRNDVLKEILINPEKYFLHQFHYVVGNDYE